MTEAAQKKMVCGIVMPISNIDGCSESHWSDVLEIITDAVESAGFVANLVSHADDVGVIHKRIIQNLYDNPIVICDVSGKNPNVMFELGMRLAFDKPTIIIKDAQTSFSFDASSIEHLEYPRDLRFSKITEFKGKLAAKIIGTHAKATSDSNYTTFLKHFGEFTVAKIDKKEVTGQEYILTEIRSMRQSLDRLERQRVTGERYGRRSRGKGDIDICLGGASDNEVQEALNFAKSLDGIHNVYLDGPSNHRHLIVSLEDGVEKDAAVIESALLKYRSPRRRQAVDKAEK